MPSPGISMFCKSRQTPQGSACFYKTWKEDASYCVSYTIWWKNKEKKNDIETAEDNEDAHIHYIKYVGGTRVGEMMRFC